MKKEEFLEMMEESVKELRKMIEEEKNAGNLHKLYTFDELSEEVKEKLYRDYLTNDDEEGYRTECEIDTLYCILSDDLPENDLKISIIENPIFASGLSVEFEGNIKIKPYFDKWADEETDKALKLYMSQYIKEIINTMPTIRLESSLFSIDDVTRRAIEILRTKNYYVQEYYVYIFFDSLFQYLHGLRNIYRQHAEKFINAPEKEWVYDLFRTTSDSLNQMFYEDGTWEEIKCQH